MLEIDPFVSTVNNLWIQHMTGHFCALYHGIIRGHRCCCKGTQPILALTKMYYSSDLTHKSCCKFFYLISTVAYIFWKILKRFLSFCFKAMLVFILRDGLTLIEIYISTLCIATEIGLLVFRLDHTVFSKRDKYKLFCTHVMSLLTYFLLRSTQPPTLRGTGNK